MDMEDVERGLVLQLYHDTDVKKESEEIYDKLKEALDGQGFETLRVIDTLKLVLMFACRDAVKQSKNNVSNKKLREMR